MISRRCIRRFAVAALGTSIALVAPSVHAQQTRFQGQVKDASGQPVAGATIRLEPVDGAGIKTEATSRKKGDFILGLVRPGSYKVTIEAPGGLVLTAIKAHSKEIGKKENDWEVDKQVTVDTPVTLEFKDGHEVDADFVVGPPQAAAAPGAASGDSLAGAVEKVQAGDCAGALPDIEAARVATPLSGRVHYLAAYCLERTGDHEKALAAIDRTIEVQPDFAGASLLRGRILRSLNRNDEAEAALKKEVETTENDTVRFDTWGALAILYRDLDRSDEAIAAFEKIIELQPSKGEAYVEMASLYTKKGDKAKAAEVLDRAKQAGASADPAALLNIGIGYMNEGKCGDALGVFRKVIDIPGLPAADQAMAWALLGRCQLNTGDMTEGAASLQKSLELDPAGSMAEENKQILAALKKK